MLQEINLYRFLPKKIKPFLTLEKIAWIYGGFLLLLLFNSSFDWWHRHQQISQLNALDQQLAKNQRELAILATRYPLFDLKNAQKSLEHMERELEVQANIVKLLSRNIKFSTYLIGLAQAAVPGVWLTEISLSAEKQSIHLQGHAVQPAALEQFLAQLARQPVFSGLSFQLEELVQDTTDKNKTNKYMNFSITTSVNSS